MINVNTFLNKVRERAASEKSLRFPKLLATESFKVFQSLKAAVMTFVLIVMLESAQQRVEYLHINIQLYNIYPYCNVEYLHVEC